MQSRLSECPILTSDIRLWLERMRCEPESYHSDEQVAVGVGGGMSTEAKGGADSRPPLLPKPRVTPRLHHNINAIFDTGQQEQCPVPPRRKKRSVESDVANGDAGGGGGGGGAGAGDATLHEPIYEKIWELRGYTRLSTSRVSTADLVTTSCSDSDWYDEAEDVLPPAYANHYTDEPTYVNVVSSGDPLALLRGHQTGDSSESDSPPPYLSCCRRDCRHAEDNTSRRRQGVDFEYHDEDATSICRFHQMIDEFQYDDISFCSQDDDEQQRIYENVPLIQYTQPSLDSDAAASPCTSSEFSWPLHTSRRLSTSAPNLCHIEYKHAALPLCTAEEVELTFERTSLIRQSSLLTASQLHLMSEQVTPRKTSVTSDIVAWTSCLYSNYSSEGDLCAMEAKELQGGGVADTPYLSKSLNSSPVVLRKADEVTLPLPEITRAKSFVHMKTRSTSFISDGPHVSDNSLTILWEALIDKSKIIDDQKKNKKWLSNTYGCLTKKTFYLFANKKTFEQLKAGSKDKGTFDIKIDLSSCEIKSKSEHSSRKNLLVLVDKQTGAEILLQDKNNQVWLAAITRVLKVDVAGQMVAAPRPKTMHINEPAALASTKEQKRIRDVLRQFFGRRPPVEQLIKSGIYKDDLVFGGDLERICHAMERPKIPPFVVVCVEAIELHMDADGLYRASGNVSQIQNLRFEVNQSNFDGLMDDKNDIHVLAGVLKLFFRELRTPVIPGSEYEHCLQAIKHRSSIDMIHELRMCLARLPTAHQDTLKYLIQHLIKVADNKENRMDVANVAMIWGPNLMQTSQIHTDLSDMYFLCSQQMKIIKTFINYYVRIFDDP